MITVKIRQLEIIIVLIAATWAIIPNSTTSINTIVLKEHGILLRPKGLVAFDANERMVSIFKKIKIPKIEKPANCQCSWMPKFNSEILKTTSYYTNLFQQICNPVDRQKRFPGAIGIGLGLADLLLTGVSYGALTHHINKVETKLNDFIETQHSFDQKMVKVDEDIIHSFSQLESDVNTSLKRIQNQILESSGTLMASELKIRWDTKLKEIFRSILDGTVTSTLTPMDLTPWELKSVIKDHTFLKDTYFAENVFGLYNTASITTTHAYLDVTNMALIIHLFMTFPMVKKPLETY